MRIEIINGPNLNLLGSREPGIYGERSFENYLQELQARYPQIEIGYFQSNVEGCLIDHIQKVGFESDGILLNAGGYTHTSVAIRDAILSIKAPVVEVHISNVAKREDFRHISIIAGACKGSVIGFGLDSYRLALESFLG